jgi:hypothetical protein
MYKDKEVKKNVKDIFLSTFQEIRIIATGPCIANQLRDVNTICRRSWYIAAHVWKIYDFKIEVVSLIGRRHTNGYELCPSSSRFIFILI